jgi:hypothetical protein
MKASGFEAREKPRAPPRVAYSMREAAAVAAIWQNEPLLGNPPR